jgi:hypothetical protein
MRLLNLRRCTLVEVMSAVVIVMTAVSQLQAFELEDYSLMDNV